MVTPPYTPVERIAEKLHRANVHIDELKGKLATFLGDAAEGEIVHDDPAEAAAYAEEQRSRAVDLQISIVIGEAIHQLRTCLDHLVCALILKDGGKVTGRSQFPIFISEPTKRDDVKDYQKQIAGITRPEVLRLIETHQPYKPSNGGALNMLAVLKRLNNSDKHAAIMWHVVSVQPKIRIETKFANGYGTYMGVDDGTQAAVSHIDASGEFIEVVNVERSLAVEVVFAEWIWDGDAIEVVFGLQAMYSSVSAIFSDLRPLL